MRGRLHRASSNLRMFRMLSSWNNYLVMVSIISIQGMLYALAANTTLITAAPNGTINTTTPTASNSSIKVTEFFFIASVGTSQPKKSTMAVPEIVLTFIIIAGCGLLGIGIAKLGDWLYDRRMATKDDISNASSYTKNILRSRFAGVKKKLKTRLVVMKMRKESKNPEEQAVRRAASAWVEAAAQFKEQETCVDNTNITTLAEPVVTVHIEGEDESQTIPTTHEQPVWPSSHTLTVAPINDEGADLSMPKNPELLSPLNNQPRSPL